MYVLIKLPNTKFMFFGLDAGLGACASDTKQKKAWINQSYDILFKYGGNSEKKEIQPNKPLLNKVR